MSGFRVSEEAEAELDGIWLHLARESGSIGIATRITDDITEGLWLLGRHPFAGVRRDDDLRPAT